MFLLLLLLRKQVLISIKRRSTKQLSNHLFYFFSSVLDYLTTGVRENFNLQQVKGFVRLNAPQTKTLGPSCRCACELAGPSLCPHQRGHKMLPKPEAGEQARPATWGGGLGEERVSIHLWITEVPDLPLHIQPQSL